MGILLSIVAGLLAAATALLFLQVLLAIRPYRPRDFSSSKRPRVAVLIPAHNEAPVIIESLRSLAAQLEGGDRLLVVADNCSDETAQIASREGAEVLERTNSSLRGKSYALEFGVRHLASYAPEVVIVVDADCQVQPGAIDRLSRLCAGMRRPVQALDIMKAPAKAQIGARLAEFAWLVKNHVRPLGYARLGMPCQLAGTGMAFPWPLIQAAPLASNDLAEDVSLGLALAHAGTPPVYCPEAVVTSRFPLDLEATSGQRTRWEHGHLRLIIRDAVPRLLDGIRGRNFALVALVLDLCVPPLSLLVLSASGILIASLILSSGGATATAVAFSLTALLLVLSSVLLAWLRFGKEIIPFSALAYAPLYAARKLPLYLRFLVRRQVQWVRTKRDGS